MLQQLDQTRRVARFKTVVKQVRGLNRLCIPGDFRIGEPINSAFIRQAPATDPIAKINRSIRAKLNIRRPRVPQETFLVLDDIRSAIWLNGETLNAARKIAEQKPSL